VWRVRRRRNHPWGHGNLLDEDYIATVSVLNRADNDARVLYPGAGLSALVGIRWKQ